MGSVLGPLVNKLSVFLMIRLLLLLSQVFMLWMLWDAFQRRCERYWYLIILLPLGEWFYFFMVKFHDPEFSRAKSVVTAAFKKPVTVESLRYRAQETPSLANRLLYAQGLHDQGDYSQAGGLFSEILHRDPKQKEALLGLGLCLQGNGDLAGAIEQFGVLIDLDHASFDYEGLGA